MEVVDTIAVEAEGATGEGSRSGGIMVAPPGMGARVRNVGVSGE